MKMGKQIAVRGLDADGHVHIIATDDRQVAHAYLEAMREDLSCVELVENPDKAD